MCWGLRQQVAGCWGGLHTLGEAGGDGTHTRKNTHMGKTGGEDTNMWKTVGNELNRKFNWENKYFQISVPSKHCKLILLGK